MKCKTDPKLIWPILFKWFIDDGSDRKEVFHWIQKFNELRKTVQMGKLLLITWTFSYTKATPFIWMANFQSLFIKKGLISFCTSLSFRFFPSAAYHQEYCFGASVMCATIWRRKIFKKLRSRFLLSLRNNGIKKYIHAKLFQHVTYLLRDKLLNTKLPLPNVSEPLIILEAEKEDFSGKKGNIQPFARGRGNFKSSFQFPTFAAATSSATTNNNFNTTTREDTRTLGHH